MRYLLILIFVLTGMLPARAQDNPHAPEQDGRVTLRGIVIEGNRKTRDRILLRELSLSPGARITRDSLSFYEQQNRLRLANLALFTDIEVKILPLPDSAAADLSIKVKERWSIWPEVSFALADRNFNVWWKEHNRDLHRANISLAVSDFNFRGNLERLKATIQLGYTQKFGIDYERPYIDRQQKHGIGFSFEAAQNQEVYVTTDSNKLRFARNEHRYIIRNFQAGIRYSYRPAYAARHLLELKYRSAFIADTIRQLNTDYFDRNSQHLRFLELVYRFDHNGVDNWNYPLRGQKVVAYTTLRAGIEGMQFQGFLNTELAHFAEPRRRWYTSFVFRGRISLTEDQPYYLRNAMGINSEYVRGYEYYVIDGYHYAIGRASFKRELINTSIRKIPFRYLPVIPLRIYPKVFADAGYVRNPHPGNSFLNNRLLYSVGAGVDLITAYDFKFRLEYAVNHLGQSGFFLHMSSE